MEHTGALWKIASGLVVFEVLIISHTLVSKKALPFTLSAVTRVLALSALASVLSLAFGYLANAAALFNFQAYANGKGWTPSAAAESFNFAQMVSLTVALLIFLIAFVAYSRTLAENIIKSGLPKGGR